MSNPKSIVVIGGGIAGLSSAMYLAEAGFRVKCIEANEQVALETSYMNGSLACASLTQPWCSMSNLRGFLTQGLFNDNEKSISVVWSKVFFNMRFWAWTVHFFMNALHTEKYNELFKTSYLLSKYSLQCMEEFNKKRAQDVQEEYQGQAKGTLQLFPTRLEQQQQLAVLSTVVDGLHSLSPEEVPHYDGVLSQTDLFSGGALLSELDRSYDVHKFCLALRRRCEEIGVEIILETRVETLECDSSNLCRVDRVVVTKAVAVAAEEGVKHFIAADAVVVANGNFSNVFAEWAGDGWHSWPVRGFALEVPLSAATASVSVPEPQPILQLRYNVVDDLRRVYISPLTPTSVRLSGFCELGSELPNKTDSVNMSMASKLLDQARTLLPKDYLAPSSAEDIKMHTCWRPQTPDDLPVVGPSRYVSNLYYNSGHGHLGLTRAMGCSKLMTDHVIASLAGDQAVTTAAGVDGGGRRDSKLQQGVVSTTFDHSTRVCSGIIDMTKLRPNRL